MLSLGTSLKRKSIWKYLVPSFSAFRTGEKCVLSFKPCGLFGKELHKVEGYIQDKR